MNPVEGKDYVLQIRVKNGPMLRAMRAAGFTSIAGLAATLDVSRAVIGEYLNLATPPQNAAGEWKKSVLAIAFALDRMPEELFPPQHYRDPLTLNHAETEISLEDLAGLVAADGGPDAVLDAGHRTRALNRALARLPERLRLVIDRRFGLSGPAEILKSIAVTGGYDGRTVTGQNIRILEQKALRRLMADPALRRELGKKRL